MTTRTTLRTGFVSACFLGALALLAPEAEAGHRHPHKASVHPHARFVPRTMAIEHRATFAPFYTGRVYSRGHRHFHSTYRFPVVVDGFVVYRPFTYCDGRLFVRAAVPVPRLAVDIVFGGDPYERWAYEPYPRFDDGPACRHDRHDDEDDD